MKTHRYNNKDKYMNKKTIASMMLLSFFVFSSLKLYGKNLTQENQSIDDRLQAIIFQKNLTGIPKSKLKIPSIYSPKAQLGKLLFFTKILGGDKTTACASCHHPLLGGGDSLSLPIGTGAKKPKVLGQNRTLQSKHELGVPRNAPTTFNIAFWKKALFHDMRIKRISKTGIHTPDVPFPQEDPLSGDNLVQAQARFPIISAPEMRGKFMQDSFNQTTRRALANRLKKNWLPAFQRGFSSPEGTLEELITEQNFSEAISAYERSQVFINTPWKAYLEGNKQAISETAKKGALLFFTTQKENGAACDTCHNGDFFTNEAAYNTAMPQIGPGKNIDATKTTDYGYFLVSQDINDKFKFRTPSLLNVEVTGPWGHDGAYTTLEAITRHMLSPIKSAKNYSPKQLKQKNIKIKNIRKNIAETLEANIDISPKPNLKKEEVTQLLSFLKTLTDPCVKDKKCLSPWIPSASENDPDGETLHAKNIEN